MLEIVDELHTRYGREKGAGTGTGSSAFPMRAGSHLPLRSPALELVKACTYVMSLDPHLRDEVSTLKRVLLAQLKV